MWSKGRVHVLPPTFVAMFLLYYFLQWFIYLLLKAPRSLRISCLFWCWPYPTLNWDISANENLCFEILIPLAAVLVISFHTCQEGGCILCFTTAVSLSWAAEPHYGSGFSWVIIPRFLFFWITCSYLFCLCVLKSFQFRRDSDQSFFRGMLGGGDMKWVFMERLGIHGKHIAGAFPDSPGVRCLKTD